MSFWKKEVPAPDLLERNQDDNANIDIFDPTYNRLSIQQQRLRLPIYKSRDHLLYLIDKFQTVIVVGQTGCGKTTQLPQYLDEAGWTKDGKIIGCTQPRRVAATSVAQRVSEEMGVELGQEVGYTIRFEDVSHPQKTRIKYMTDGMLFRETLIDPLLSKYSVIILDEAHERSLYTDILMGVIKKIQKKRPELRVIISSATVDAQAFHEFFNENETNELEKDTSAIISLEGRMFPVDIFYQQQPCADYVKKAVETVLDIHQKEAPGDILVFMTGKEEIEEVVGLLYEATSSFSSRTQKLDPLPLYAGLPNEQQMAIFERTASNARKVIVSTNVAEASLTIDGIVYVVDPGFVKLRAFNPKTGMSGLTIVPISKASAKQRAGRAGRLQPGKVFRLYTEEAYHRMKEQSIPEMQRSNLAPVILQLKALGIENVLRFNYMTPPPAELMIRALELLYSLKAVDDYGRLTIPLGMQLAEIPLDPMMGKILLDSSQFGCGEDMLTIAAMTSVQNIFVGGYEADAERLKFGVEEGDHITLLNVYNAFLKHQKSAKWCHRYHLNYRALTRASSIRHQLLKYLLRFNITPKSCEGDTIKIRKCLVSGYFSQAAKVQPDGLSYRTIRDDVELHIHPSSVLFRRSPKVVIFHEVVETTKAYMRDITVVEPAWLTELAPHFYEVKEPRRSAF
ncbi:hypothetical protein K7432_002950 [Basidiobolus ranarum]|uniref:RNA helicase n=2 Tax=Basidiobolus ranarum TaxID=34480 RepID=A0ABR2X0P3_9FUNG